MYNIKGFIKKSILVVFCFLSISFISMAANFNSIIGQFYLNGSEKYTIGTSSGGDDLTDDTVFSNFMSLEGVNSGILAIDNRKKLWAIGSNKNNRLGLEDENNHLSWTELTGDIKNEKILKVAIDNVFSYALTESGKIWFSGANGYSPMGVNDTNTRKEFEEINSGLITNEIIVDITTTQDAGYAVDNTGTIWYAGRGTSGRFGDGENKNYTEWSEHTTGDIAAKNILKVSAGTGHVYALDDSGKLWMAGYNQKGALGTGNTNGVNIWSNPIGLIDDIVIKDIFSFYYSSYAVDENGGLWVVGGNSFGELGVGNNTNLKEWTKVTQGGVNGIEKVKIIKVAADVFNAYALDENGDLWSTGYNQFGQLGLGNRSNKTSWTKINHFEGIGLTFKNIVVSGYSAIAIDKNDEIWVVGKNSGGQLGIGDTVESSTWLKQ